MSGEALVKKAMSAVEAGNADAPAFLAMLKHMQAHPAEYKTAHVANVLFATLPAFSGSEFTACLCLLPEKAFERDEIKAVLALEDMLCRGEFADFWAQVEEAKAASKVTVGAAWSKTMQANIAAALRDAFQSVDEAFVKAACNVKDAAALKDLIGADQFKAAGGKVQFTQNAFNTPPPPVQPKQLTSAMVARMVKTA